VAGYTSGRTATNLSNEVETRAPAQCLHPSAPLNLHPKWQAAKNSMNLSPSTSQARENSQTDRWKMKWDYCTPDAVVEHREPRCTEHLSKRERCRNKRRKNLVSLPDQNTCTYIFARVDSQKVADLTRNLDHSIPSDIQK